jgi:hypothetical protein
MPFEKGLIVIKSGIMRKSNRTSLEMNETRAKKLELVKQIFNSKTTAKAIDSALDVVINLATSDLNSVLPPLYWSKILGEGKNAIKLKYVTKEEF